MTDYIRGRRLVVAGALVTQFVVIGGLFAYGVLFKSLESDLGWSRTLLSAVSSLSFLIMGTLAIVGGQLNDRFGPRWVLSFAGLCYGIGYALLGSIDSPWQLFVLGGLMLGIGMSTHDVVTLSVIARWFPARRGVMSGVVKVGTAVGQMFVPLAATALIAAFGWRRACEVLGIVAGLALVLAAQGMRRDPPPTTPDVAKPRATARATASAAPGLSFREIVRTRAFWTLCAIQFLFFPVLVTIPVHIVPHGTDMGLGAAVAAGMLSMIGAASIAGRLVVGSAVDRIGARKAMLMCLVVLAASLLILRATRDPAWLFAFAAVYGTAHGGLFTVVSPTAAEFFGMRAHGVAFGVILFFGTIGGAFGPILAGRAFDQDGSYELAFSLLAGMAIMAFALAATLPRPRPG
ncbi:MAG: MFS transporter [Burkholderiaceae bacterium]|nr:MFS transporter [Burkholderiaceae bacterium]